MFNVALRCIKQTFSLLNYIYFFKYLHWYIPPLHDSAHLLNHFFAFQNNTLSIIPEGREKYIHFFIYFLLNVNAAIGGGPALVFCSAGLLMDLVFRDTVGLS